MADDIKQLIEEKTEETKRHFDVVAENLEKNIVGAMKEELQMHGQQITALQGDVTSLKQDMGQVKDDVSAVKVTLESANLLDSKQQFADLQKRVVVLESKER